MAEWKSLLSSGRRVESGSRRKDEKPHITAEERRRRQEAVDYARASVGLEGFKLSEADEAHAERFINGEIDINEFVKVRRG